MGILNRCPDAQRRRERRENGEKPASFETNKRKLGFGGFLSNKMHFTRDHHKKKVKYIARGLFMI